MSVPNKNTTWGNILYEGKEYGVLNTQLSDEIVQKLNQYQKYNDLQTYTSAPWMRKIDWCVENGQLYLTKLYTNEIHKEIFGSEEKILADWVSEMKLLVKHSRICKTYERRNSYLNEMDTLYLSLNQGDIVYKGNETKLYTSIEMKNYIDNEEENEIVWSPPYSTLRIESMKLFDYLEDKTTQQAEDQIFPLMSNLIDQMIQKCGKEDICLGVEDVKTVLSEGEIAVFASAKGRDIDEMVASLVYSMTDEVLKAKGCLMHLTMNNEYPISDIERIVNYFENKLGFNEINSSSLPRKHIQPFVFGTCVSDEMDKDEVLIRVLLGI